MKFNKIFTLLSVLIAANIVIFLLFNSCTTTGPAAVLSGVSLTVDNVSAEEIWLKCEKGDASGLTKVIIRRDDKRLIGFSLWGRDTVICDDSIQPGKSYSYQAFLFQDDLSKGTTNTVSARAMDTTSHDFTWQAFLFGVPGTSSLSGASFINENDIWAVGDVYLKDSLGQIEEPRYNAFHWNGIVWEKKRAYDAINETTPLLGVFAINPNIIICSDGSPYFKIKDGWKLYHLWNLGILKNSNGLIHKIWGSSMSDIYFTGRTGSIVYNSSGNWYFIDVKERYDFNDVFGITDPKDNSITVFCAGSDYGDLFDNDQSFRKAKLIKITNRTKVDSVHWNGKPLITLWTNDGKRFYAGAGEIFSNKRGAWQKVLTGGGDNIINIRGNGMNDIFAVGSFGTILHFNGKTWKAYNGFGGMHFSTVTVKDNLVVAAGSTNSAQGVVVIGKRN